jgi:2-polyprenyl-3-methyl-5-hydroxy-6-metoxy-1,4-benzoquinol methylase
VTHRRDHYSYTVYADPVTARSFDERRFGGPIGDLVARDQAEAMLRFLGPVRGLSVLDVGTGTGRAALLLAGEGAIATGVDASEEMLTVARKRAAEQRSDVHFARGDAHALDFPDGAFDIAISLRVLMHTPGWRQSVGELCRVARSRVIVDYPSVHSTALLHSAARRLQHLAGQTTEPYRVFSDGAVASAFTAHGFRIRGIHRQFVLPIALHKAIGSSGFTRTSEGVLARLGLLSVFGSPVTVVAERCATS